MSDRFRLGGGRWAAFVVLIAILSLGACGAGSRPRRSNATIVLNDAHPSFRGVSLGDSHAQLLARLGKAPLDTAAYGVLTLPFGVNDPTDELGLPATGPSPPSSTLPLLKRLHTIRTVAYRNVVFLVSSTRAGVYYFGITASGARTSRGVGIGDSLARARATYGQILHCATADQGTEYPQFPYCGARLGRHLYIYFGQDPIRSIAFASTWLP